jgi:CheY-like chemotaxis protein/phosphoribosyl 1,2-cyclic phosphodiesterase
MRVQFWGTRGSVATPGPTTLRYGGNTSCVELRTDAGTLIIFDCGTGARVLGQSLLAQGAPVKGSILLGHSHWDHIQGFPFFAPIFLPASSFTIYAPSGGDKRLSEVLAGQMEYTYFPVSLDQLQSRISFQDLGEDTFSIGEATVQTQYLNHTALTLGYRVSVGGATVIYATDHEPHARHLWRQDGEAGRREVVHHGDQRHIDFLANADLVIHDSQYTELEYSQKIGWGHSSVEYAVDVCAEAGVKRLALFHHDPSRDDGWLDRLVADCQRRAEQTGADLAVFGACEGRGLYLREQPHQETKALLPSGPNLPERARVLIAEDDVSTRGLLADLLSDDDYELFIAADGHQALALVESIQPDLVLLDLAMPRLDGKAVCRALKAGARTAAIPVIMLTASAAERDIAEGFEEGATDYITKPFAPAMVRTRIRSWLLRSDAQQAASGTADGRA